MRTTDVFSPSAKGKRRPLMVMDMADLERSVLDSGDFRSRRLERWEREARWQLMAFHKGRVLKRTNSGLMMEFADERSCLQAAFELAQLASSMDSRATGADRLNMRAAAHLADYSRDSGEVSGRDAKLAHELAAMARPGDVLLTAELRNQLSDSVDADFEDLGEQLVGLLPHSIRVFRAYRRRDEALGWAAVAKHDLRPGLAVLPFQGGVPEAGRGVIGELIADGVIARLSQSIGIRIISRESTSDFRHCDALSELERHLGATFVLSGTYRIQGRILIVNAELSEVRSHTLLWSGQLRRLMGDFFHEDSELLFQLAYKVAQALGSAQVSRPLAQPLPRLSSNALLQSAITMTHSDSPPMLERARKALIALTERHPEFALPKIWLGMWHVLNLIKGKSNDIHADTRTAREQSMLALEVEPANALAMAFAGYVQCQILGNPQQARAFLDASIDANPSEPMAWLFRSVYSSMWGSASASVTEAHIARSLSPADPLRYFFDLLTANALLTDNRHEQAITYAGRSLRADRHHVPTLRLLLTAQAEMGRMEEGRKTLDTLLTEVPGLTLSSYLAMGSADSPTRQRCARAMRQLGLPEGRRVLVQDKKPLPSQRGNRSQRSGISR